MLAQKPLCPSPCQSKTYGAPLGSCSTLRHGCLRGGCTPLRRPMVARAGEEKQPVAPAQEPPATQPKQATRRQADSTDPVASFLSRRFGLAGGLGWLSVLAIGTLGEQVKTRMEVAEEEKGTQEVSDAEEVVLPDGVSYKDLRKGGGSTPIKGYLAVIDFTAKANGEVFEDTRARGKPIVVFTGSRPFTGGLCEGVEEAMSSMRAGGRRLIKVPPSKGFGDAGTVLKPTNHVPGKSGVIPGDAFLEYDLELLRVSIPP
ncbi:FKBP-type peptidyl-prolyl cis-trans isomerase [Dunaliella salina]|uniref:peptidylprolyl isomerase n=1 Tax=Dunaliella salina TaxID=3046 RepID=A0ABQ7GIY9_DUNSA|nr:FKBP-type peptidyl-prolyl cis-trans isomerase [Dunaliella salina]|eukprot:KAF5834570.1 FKBP-type peptidyl-prolyl cis-trans isomerase [Dunaliella salina]